jgi:hypothetical protein
MSSITAPLAPAKRLVLAVVLAGLLSALLVPSAFAACMDGPCGGDGEYSGGTPVNYQYKVYESAGQVNTKSVKAGQHVRVSANAQQQIWAGMAFSGKNGPAGWTSLGNSQTPAPSMRAFSLLAKIGPKYYYVGNGTTSDIIAEQDGCVELWINDDVVNNGSGYFEANVQVL